MQQTTSTLQKLRLAPPQLSGQAKNQNQLALMRFIEATNYSTIIKVHFVYN